ncbi:hypothetical protein DFH06DRAFT_1324677 [Mycena polygramma]|nr:hypothetical protein DFH06DRAFT_1324677 [Mycena polygramma]
MSGERRAPSQRRTVTPLPVDLTLVPLVNRPLHPAFQAREAAASQSQARESAASQTTQVLELPSPVAGPTAETPGAMRTLPKLATANSVYFKDSLARLEEHSGRKYVLPGGVKTEDAEDLPGPLAEDSEDAPAVEPEIRLWPSLVIIGLKNIETGTTDTAITVVNVPYCVFLSQLIRAVWPASLSLQRTVGKWSSRRIFVACSRWIVYMEDEANLTSQGRRDAGFREVGYFADIVRSLDDTIGGVRDEIASPVEERPGKHDVEELKRRYGVSASGIGGTYSLYFYYVDEGTLAASRAATGLSSPVRPAPAASSSRSVEVKGKGKASSEDGDDDIRPQAYLEQANIAPLELCKSITRYDFASAYKMYSNARLYPDIVAELHGTWPKTGVPSKPWSARDTDFPSLQISLEDLLSYCKGPSAATFGNHYMWFKQAKGAVHLLNANIEHLTANIERLPNVDELLTHGMSLHALINGPLLDPSTPGFIVPDEYKDITTTSMAETKTWVSDIEKHFNKNK